MKKQMLSACFMPGLMMLILISCSQKETASKDAVESKIDSLISQMTLEEKVGMIHANSSFTTAAVPRLGIPEWVMSDGPHGVRKEHGRDWIPDTDAKDSATCLPTGVGLAATWNPELGYEFGKVLGSEANYRGKDVILGPGINIMRTPLNGRNFEYLSEDPYLISRMAVGYIKGVQDQGIAACVKHYLANNQEWERNNVNVDMDERTLREIYLPGFKAAVQEGGVYTLMGSYNKFRGQYCTHNEYTINKILKGEWNFQGAVISDWGAVHNTLEALKYGTDVEMGTDLGMLPKPDYSKFFLGDTVISLVKSGAVEESLVDEKVRRILRVMIKTNKFGKRQPGSFNTPGHQATALKVAQESIVLLKNENGLLPLKKEAVKTIAVIGANADRKHCGAGGSSQVNAKYEITPLAGLKKMLGNNVTYKIAPGYEIKKDAKVTKQMIDEAVRAAKTSTTAIYFGGYIHGYSDDWNDNEYDCEGEDKPDMKLPFAQDDVIEAVLNANPNTILVFNGGSAFDMTRWVGKAKAIVQVWYPGIEGGNAIAQVLFGEINPSGKLPVTFPVKLEDSPAHAMGAYPGDKNLNEFYKEGLLVGYRYFDTKKVTPQFAFGHGLSYTTFTFDKLDIKKGGDSTVSVSVKVTNTGKVGGAEVVQVYVTDEQSSVERPAQELKGFSKVFLQPGESKTVEIKLAKDAFQFYDDGKKKFVLESGKFGLNVGNSSRDIKLTGSIDF